jgi:hypothetical protein
MRRKPPNYGSRSFLLYKSRAWTSLNAEALFRNVSAGNRDIAMKTIEDMPRVSLIVAFVAIALVGCGPSYPAIPTMKQAYATIDDMARRTKGDYTKLTPAEQSQIDAFARGHGKDYLSKRYKIITTGGK